MKRIVVREHDLHSIGDTRTFRTLYVPGGAGRPLFHFELGLNIVPGRVHHHSFGLKKGRSRSPRP